MSIKKVVLVALLLSQVTAAMLPLRKLSSIDPIAYPEWYKFAEKYRCSPEIERIISRAKKKLVLGKSVFSYLGTLFYNKGTDICRIDNARRMKKCIELYGLKTWDVADKFLCEIEDAWYVIAADPLGEFFDEDDYEPEERIFLQKEIGYNDLHERNVIRKPNGVRVIIDTEDLSFFRYNIPGQYRFKKKYDDPEIDFNQVKKEYQRWQEEMAEKKRAALLDLERWRVGMALVRGELEKTKGN